MGTFKTFSKWLGWRTYKHDLEGICDIIFYVCLIIFILSAGSVFSYHKNFLKPEIANSLSPHILVLYFVIGISALLVIISYVGLVNSQSKNHLVAIEKARKVMIKHTEHEDALIRLIEITKTSMDPAKLNNYLVRFYYVD